MTIDQMPDFAFDDTVEELPPVILDRSTVERYTICPYQAWMMEQVQPFGSPEADSGSEVHRIIAMGVDGYAQNSIPPRDIMEQEMPKARPDVQPDAIEALRPCIWRINDLLTSRNPKDIIAYEGGPGDQSGQFAADLLPATEMRGPIRITSEIDLLLAGTTASEVEEIDWKSGHKCWRSSDVRDAFQFQLHAWLIFHNYPDVEQAHVSIWNTRLRGSTPPYTFRRGMMETFTARLTEAVRYREQPGSGRIGQLHDAVTTPPECWPQHSKCRICDVIRDCPRAAHPSIGLNTGPAQYARDTELMALALEQRRQDLRAYVDAHGDLDLGHGREFGLGEAKKPKKPTIASYRFYASRPIEEDNGSED